jgi:hypothetical protein
MPCTHVRIRFANATRLHQPFYHLKIFQRLPTHPVYRIVYLTGIPPISSPLAPWAGAAVFTTMLPYGTIVNRDFLPLVDAIQDSRTAVGLEVRHPAGEGAAIVEGVPAEGQTGEVPSGLLSLSEIGPSAIWHGCLCDAILHAVLGLFGKALCSLLNSVLFHCFHPFKHERRFDRSELHRKF